MENLRFEQVEPHGGGVTFKRDDQIGHGKYLLKRTTLVKASLSVKKDFDFSKNLFVNIRSPLKVPIKSEKLKLKNLGFEIISLNKADINSCLAKISKDKFDQLAEKISKYTFEPDHPGKTNLAILEDIEEVKVDDKMAALEKGSSKQDVIIYLHHNLSQKEKFLILNNIESDFIKAGVKTESQIFPNGRPIVSCSAEYATIKKIASFYSTVNKVEINSTFYVKRSVPVLPLPSSLKVNAAISDSVVAIIDSGIQASAVPFQNLITSHLRFLPARAVDIDPDHGSFVASRCLYGDEIDICFTTNTLMPYCRVMDVTVFGNDARGRSIGPTDDFLVNVIGQVVKKHYKDIKVYNLSLGKPESINDHEFSEVAKQIDYLSKTYNVIFVVASGNINSPLGNYPHDHFSHKDSRLGAPAEALLAVTVGSIAKYVNTNCLAVKDEISPFSRIGPGADLGLKPEIVCHGGNLVKGYTSNPRTSSYGINHKGDHLAVDVGTSFSAPIISQFVVRLMDAFPDATTNLIKALLFHFAEKRSIPSTILNPHTFYTGFGEPHIENSISSAPNTFSYFFEGVLDQQRYQYVGFHIPSIFKTRSDAKLKIKITIVFDPQVNPTNDMEYSMARISATLYKAHNTGFKEITVPTADKYNLPWNPILQFEKEFSRGFLCGYWELRLRLFTRGPIGEKYKQGYAVIIEIIDSKNKIDVFNETVNEFGSKYDLKSREEAA
ncbi:MAG: hypothetical protein C0154_02995 [Mucilaginibacter sp.]|uniref:S8 family peptidase n=1 Tax=Mucilaginibacter defluvii TaxID=1196019 RepID=A0ABP9FV85_9SPHI|nr:MAG: hypothetical protein C0154_02995 [Mucilaginibacter sp.]